MPGYVQPLLHHALGMITIMTLDMATPTNLCSSFVEKVEWSVPAKDTCIHISGMVRDLL